MKAEEKPPNSIAKRFVEIEAGCVHYGDKGDKNRGYSKHLHSGYSQGLVL